MHPFPHVYQVSAKSTHDSLVEVSAQGLPALQTSAPPEFDGPSGNWSPETMLCASVANCLILTFRAIARASRFDWTHLTCEVDGTLERVEGTSRFTLFVSRARLVVPAGADESKARLLLEKAEHGCLIANSLTAKRELVAEIIQAD
jgi:organic hydroperoxide reductase OsmC/OhrA